MHLPATIAVLSLALFTLTIAKYKQTTRSLTFSPQWTSHQGARILTNPSEVFPINDEWKVEIFSQSQWQFLLSLDSSFGFDPLLQSTISITVNSDSTGLSSTAQHTVTPHELLLGFTSDNSQYISVAVPLTLTPGSSPQLPPLTSNRIYPSCHQSPLTPEMRIDPFGIGDIASLPDHNRNCDIAGGTCTKWKDMFPIFDIAAVPDSVTVTLDNDPITHEMTVYLDQGYHTQQSCTFGNSFPTERGLKIFVAGNDPSQTYMIRSFDIESVDHYPTSSPTTDPTTSPTRNPTKSPTQFPTKYPTISPTDFPTYVPTDTPTDAPTHFPTETPSKFPTKGPSTSPTKRPTVFPTGGPTKRPTAFPTKKPTTFPTKRPTAFPTTRPTTPAPIIPAVVPVPAPVPVPVPVPVPAPLPTQPQTVPAVPSVPVPAPLPTDHLPITPGVVPVPAPVPTDPLRIVPSTNAVTVVPLSPLPEGWLWGAYGQYCAQAGRKKCNSRTEVNVVDNGRAVCATPYDCCMCESIQCGTMGQPCSVFQANGLWGAYGVKDIQLVGDSLPNVEGVYIDCSGREGCKETHITAQSVKAIVCDGYQACLGAVITVTDPKQYLLLECKGHSACERLTVEITFTHVGPCATRTVHEFTKLICNGESACRDLDLKLTNIGCDEVVIHDLECLSGADVCTGAAFNFIGDVRIANCMCGPSCNNAHGLDMCFENLEKVVCGSPNACEAQSKTLYNPTNGFEFVCSDVQSCADSHFVMEINNAPSKIETVTYFSALKMGGEYSARGATFEVRNLQSSDMTIGKLECGGMGACEGATFITGTNVFFDTVVCSQNSCTGCVIQQTVNGLALPCDPQQL